MEYHCCNIDRANVLHRSDTRLLWWGVLGASGAFLAMSRGFFSVIRHTTRGISVGLKQNFIEENRTMCVSQIMLTVRFTAECCLRRVKMYDPLIYTSGCLR